MGDAMNSLLEAEARGIVFALDARCRSTASHSVRLASNAARVGSVIGLDPSAADNVSQAAYLHDVGKVGIADSILWKAGPLSFDEREVMRTHPLIGERLLSRSPFPRSVQRAVRYHHERFDGAGYPDGIAGSAIPIGARIIAVVDAYDAMRSARPYSGAVGRLEALRRLRLGCGLQFDADVVEVFEGIAAEEPPDEPFVWDGVPSIA